MRDPGQSFSVSRVLATACEEANCRFKMCDRELSPYEVFDRNLFLPVIAARAEERMQRLFGKGAGVEFKEEGNALFGTTVTVDPLDENDGANRVLVFFEAADRIFGIDKNVWVDLNPVYERYSDPANIDKGVTRWPVARVSPI